MVSRGLALAYRRYSLGYVDKETDAQAARRGIWAGEFVPPWEWRRGKRLPSKGLGAGTAQGARLLSTTADKTGNLGIGPGLPITWPRDRDLVSKGLNDPRSFYREMEGL